MSPAVPRLLFLYPAFLPTLLKTTSRQSARRGAAVLRQRHGTAVDPSGVVKRGTAAEGKGKVEGKDINEVGKDEKGVLETLNVPISEIITTPPPDTVSETAKPPASESSPSPATPPPSPEARADSEQPDTPHTPPAEPSSEPAQPEIGLAPIANPYENQEHGTKYHFDTYTQLQTLRQASFTPTQSSLIISAVQSKLDEGLTSASSQLISRSRTENESYLFHAACSELRSEIESLRRRHTEEMRIQRASAKAEFDATNTAFQQEIGEYKNALRGMFDERKMEVRAEQRAMENKIQELNYKITVLIQSELKSDVEGLRWITTRRGLLAIATLAVFIVLGIKLNTKPKEGKKKDEGPPEGTPFAGVVGLG